MNGGIWIGTTRGLFNLDWKTGSFHTYPSDPQVKFSISDSNITAIYEDSHGQLWVGTANGLNIFDPNIGTFVTYVNNPNEMESISNNNITLYI